jgi:hypothetical protein
MDRSPVRDTAVRRVDDEAQRRMAELTKAVDVREVRCDDE